MKETVLQFGTGNFLRGFFNHFLHVLNEKGLYEGKAVIVQPTNGRTGDVINAQGGVYNLLIRGIENGEAVSQRTEIHSVSRAVSPYTDFDGFLALAENPDLRFIVSNTTESGIEFNPECSFNDRPAASFPGKLCQLLYRRFELRLGGLVILPCELIDRNGEALKAAVKKYAELWKLGEVFLRWIEDENRFCSTLVDRIVTGYPTEEAEALQKEIGYDDKLLDTAEPFHLWVIEGDFEGELPLQKAGLNVIWTKDVSPYKKMKVRILNGAHTSLVFPSMLSGIETVRESVGDVLLNEYLNRCIFDYIIPTVGDTKENRGFAEAVLSRFANPYIRHLWKSISLNSISKFSVRVLPTVKEYYQSTGVCPRPLVLSLACLIKYYKTEEPSDSKALIEKMRALSIEAILTDKELFGEDISFLKDELILCTERLSECGITEAIKWALS